MHRTRVYRGIIVLALAALLPAFAAAQRVHLRIPLTIKDANGYGTMVYFVADPVATSCVDPSLGEHKLPSDRCGSSSIFAYFGDTYADSDTCLRNGLLVDYHT